MGQERREKKVMVKKTSSDEYLLRFHPHYLLPRAEGKQIRNFLEMKKTLGLSHRNF